MMAHLAAGDCEAAAEAYASYVLDVRDGFELCNARLRALRGYYEDAR